MLLALPTLTTLSVAVGPGGGVPPIAVLAAQQQAVKILLRGWPTVCEELLKGEFTGAGVRADRSEIHGTGLFATEDLPAGSLVALHPVDRVLQNLGNGQFAGALMDDDADGAYFRATGVSADELAARQLDYRRSYRHVDPRRPEAFMLDANPQKPDIPGWLGHRINDGAAHVPSPDGAADEEALLQYYAESGEARNVCSVALCVPLLGFVTTRGVRAGDELLATYGHKVWTSGASSKSGNGADAADGSKKVGAAEAEVLREADLAQIAADEKYFKQNRNLGALIAQTSAALVEDEDE